ncbi:MAG TPA: type II toxin-antitoxin system RelE/ParE family toxin, partial [Gammaproteobacteria bacterium]|nr:type II toxin-antitoxin system RelE/ParE family toxin [Gammaproteobacteria bacterium]
QADRYIAELDSCFETLSSNPKLGRERHDIKTGYRSFPVGAHVVFYRITNSGIEIIGIPHQREDPINHIDQIS